MANDSFNQDMSALIKRLEQLPVKAQNNVAKALVNELAKRTAEKAKQILQGKISNRTGRLKDSVKFKRNRGEKNIMSASAISDVFYSKFFEFGTSKMTARPFLNPAAEEVFRDMPNIVQPLLSELVEKQFSKLNKKWLKGR